jgi:hypothetical protein
MHPSIITIAKMLAAGEHSDSSSSTIGSSLSKILERYVWLCHPQTPYWYRPTFRLESHPQSMDPIHSLCCSLLIDTLLERRRLIRVFSRHFCILLTKAMSIFSSTASMRSLYCPVYRL